MEERHTGEWEPAAAEISALVTGRVSDLARKAADEMYASLMEATQDYLADNVAFNIKSRLDAAERERRALWERADHLERVNAKLLEALEHFVTSAEHEWEIPDSKRDDEGWIVDTLGHDLGGSYLNARSAISLATGETPADERECCFICDRPLVEGELVLDDVTEGTGHRACFGDDRDGFLKDIDTGEPLGPDDPLPTGYPYEPTALREAAAKARGGSREG